MSEGIITKPCRRCNAVKPISEFYTDKYRKDGHYPYCKTCHGAIVRAYSLTPKGKEAHKKARVKYLATDKGKKYIKHWHKIGWRSPRAQISRARYDQSEKGKLNRQRCHYRYQRSLKGKVAQARYRRSKKGQLCRQRYRIRREAQIKARSAVHSAIRSGRLPHPRHLLCSCGQQARDYHHHKGYEKSHWLDVLPVCETCHPTIPKSTSFSCGD